MKSLYLIRLSFFAVFLFFGASLSAQNVTVSGITGGVTGSPITAGTTNVAVLGVQLAKAGGGANTLTALSFGLTTDPTGKFSNARLYKSADNTFGGIGSETFVASGTLNTSTASFTGTPLTDFGGGNGAVTEFYFLVVDVDPTVTGASTAIQPSLANADVSVSAGTVSGSATGTNYSFTAPNITIANLSTGLAGSPLLAGSAGNGVFGFSLTSTSTQAVDAINIQVNTTPVSKWGSYALIKSTDNSFSTTGDNSAPIGGLTFTPMATEIAISGLSESITTSATYYFLIVDVSGTVNAATPAIQPSLGASNVSALTGTVSGSASGTSYNFSPLLTITNLSTGLAPSPLIAGTNDKGVFGFSLSSSGSQTVTIVNVQVTGGSPASKWTTASYELITSTDNDFATTGDNSAPIGGLTFTPSASQIAISGLSQVITTGTNYFLVVDIDPAVTGATSNIQPSLGASNVIVSSGGTSGSAVGTNYSFSVATLTFTEITPGTAPVMNGTILGAGSTLQVLTGFMVTSNGTQQATSIGFNYTGLSGQISPNEYLYRSSTAGAIGSLVATDNTPDGTFISLSETIDTTPAYFYLVVDISNSVTQATGSLTVAPTEANVTVTSGNKNAFSINRVFTFGTSQQSNIIFTVSASSPLNYRNIQLAAIHDTDLSKSHRLGTFQVQDGGGAADSDNKATSITSIRIQISNFANIRTVALFDDDAGPSEISGTETPINGVGTGIITFTPTNPIRTASDGGVFNFIVRATFMSAVTDNQAMIVTIDSVVSENGYSGFASPNAGGANSSSGTNHSILVTATKLILSPGVSPTTQGVGGTFGFTIKAVDGNPFNNVDKDYAGKVDVTASGGPGSLAGGGQKTLSLGTFVVAGASINQSGTYTIDVSDDDYTDAPDNQSDIGDATGSITITAASSTITTATTSPANICYGSSYFPLSNIVITETDAAGISGPSQAYTFSIALPSGFVFDQSVTTGVSTTGGSDITIPATPHYSYPSANIVQFSYNLTGTANINTITISGLKVGSPHPGTASPGNLGPLDITRSGGTGNVAGVASGTVLGTVSASSQGSAVTITVAALSGDVAINPTTTNFNTNANAVNLVGSPAPPATGVFTGSGVTFVNPNYRFNPSSLSPGIYPITYVHTNTSGCQSVGIKNFTVFTSGIGNLNPSYCNNDPVSNAFTVDQTFIDQRMGAGGWSVDHFTYYDPNIGDFTKITTPANNKFDPSLPVYQSIIQYFGGEIPIGFAVCNPGAGVPCDGNSNTGTFSTYQWVRVYSAPAVSFTLPSDIYSYCEDNVAVELKGTPENTNIIADDFFNAGTQNASISHQLVSGKEVWSFSPAAVTGVTSSASQTLDITYHYTDPATGCTNESTRSITVHDRPTAVPSTDIKKLPLGAPVATTTIQLCQGYAGAFSFSAIDSTYKYRWYPNPIVPGTEKIGFKFNPIVNTSIAGSTTFNVTRERNGCESITTPLALTVSIVASPAAPAPNFTDAVRQYCVGTSINNAHLGVPGTNIKWYNSLGVLVFSGSNPTATDLSLTTAAANTYTFFVTQTEAVNGCEGPATTLTVTVKALPVVAISADADPTKICTTAPSDITFTAVDNAAGGTSATNGTWSGIPAGSLNDFPTSGKVVLHPAALTAGPYTLQYTYTNSGGCSNSGTIGVTILPIITPAVSVSTVCNESPVIITNNSTITTGGSIAQAEWDFGDGSVLSPAGNYAAPIDPAVHLGRTTGTYKDPRHVYPNTGTTTSTFQLKGVLISSNGCRYDIPQQPVVVNPLPIGNFSITNVCVNSPTDFVGSTNLPAASIQSYTWNFAKGGILTAGTSSGANASFTYSSTGRDTVVMVVTTNANCKDTVEKPVFIVPTYTSIDSETSYSQDFTTNGDANGGWLAGGANSSWALGIPVAVPAIGDAAPAGNAWDTNLSGSNNSNESSWVLSGCFDFSGAAKPVLSLDIWSDNPNGVDGAVLQYNTSGNIEDDILNDPDPDGDWVVLGNVGAGINWYDDQGISNSPGNQTTVSAGWTGRYAGWKKAIFKLDPLIGQSKVAFRIAFSSSQPRGNGFAFDNFFIGERSRLVLLENFTNSSVSPTVHNDLYRNFGTAAEVVKVQYHTPFPGVDPINEMNRQMNNSRAAFYGITSAPTIRIDGEGTTGPAALLQKYDDRVLTPSFLKLNVTATKVGSVVKINTVVENITSQTVPLKGANIFTVVVQKSITDASLLSTSGNSEFVYVAKEILPSPAGFTIPDDLPAGDTYEVPELTWDNPNGDAIIVFVQSTDGGNKNVYQAQLIPGPILPDANIVTGVEPSFNDQVKIYPNPAHHEVNIMLPEVVRETTPVKMYDTFGNTVVNDELKKGTQTKTIHTHELAAGLYFIQLETKTGLIKKKVMVVHNNN